MSKKKVAKLGLTAAVAATTFVAANPADAASVSQAEQAVKKAEQNAKGLVKFYSSEDLKVSAEFTASYNNVRKLISDAKAQLANYKGKDKSQLEAILASAENHQAAAARYIDAVGILNGKLVESTKAVSAYIKSQELNADTVAAYDTLSAEIKKAEAVIGKVRGAQIRKAFKDSFLLDAKLTREALIYEVSQYQLLNQINEKLKAEKVDLKEVQADFAKLDRLKERAVDIKKAGKELYPDRDDVYPTHTAIEQQLRKSEADAKEAYVGKLDPVVESVSAVNAKQIVVTFNKSIKKSTVISNDTTGALVANTISVKRTVTDSVANKNVDYPTTDTVTGSLSEDGKSLTLTVDASTAKYLDGSYSVTVANSVKATDGTAVKAFAGTVSTKDETKPEVTGVTYDTITGQVEVTVSEPITAVPEVVRVDGQPVTTPVTFVANKNQTKVVFAKPTSVDSGTTKSVEISGAVDAAGNILTRYTGNVTFTADAAAPQVESITQLSSNKAKIVFSKALPTGSDATIDGAINVILDGTPMVAGDVTAALDADDKSNRTVVVTLAGGAAPNYFYGNASSKTLTFAFANEVITDVFGKKLESVTKNVTMTKDVTGPKVVSVALADNKTDLEVTFDEEVAAAGTVANIVLRKDGVALTTPATATRKGATKGEEKVLVITPAAGDLVNGKLPKGEYSVRLETGAITDAHTNKNSASTNTVSVDGDAAKLTASFANAGGTPNEFEVTYSEDVATTSALNLANYTLDGSALPAGTDIYFKAGQANRVVVIKLPKESINIGAQAGTNARLGVNGVQSKSGDKTVEAKSATVLVADNTAATVQTAQLVGSNVLKLTFNENIDNAFAIADLEIKSDAGTFAVSDTTATATKSGKDLVITFAPGTVDNYATVVAGANLKVKTLDTGADTTDGLTGTLVDANGYAVKAGVQVNVSK
ncbi:hypothetical protein [Metabacillus fastidiosus]|nr:hypothetical protein [Metabacillus fastidiosus]MED4461147.1 hypothetical protein [Metabacillus fastidiosus]